MSDEHMSAEEAHRCIDWYKKHNTLQALKLCPNITDLFRYIDALEVAIEHVDDNLLRADIVQEELQELECEYFKRIQLVYDDLKGSSKPEDSYRLATVLCTCLAQRDTILEVARRLNVEVEKTEAL